MEHSNKRLPKTYNNISSYDLDSMAWTVKADNKHTHDTLLHKNTTYKHSEWKGYLDWVNTQKQQTQPMYYTRGGLSRDSIENIVSQTTNYADLQSMSEHNLRDFMQTMLQNNISN